jgi:hypothetical protein
MVGLGVACRMFCRSGSIAQYAVAIAREGGKSKSQASAFLAPACRKVLFGGKTCSSVWLLIKLSNCRNNIVRLDIIVPEDAHIRRHGLAYSFGAWVSFARSEQ